MDLWLDLLNSDWHDYRGSGRREDRLQDREWLHRYTAHWKQSLTGVSESSIRTELKDLRILLRGIVDRLASGRPLPRRSWNQLNDVLAAAPISRRLVRSPGGFALDLVPVQRGIAGVIAEIAASFCRTLAESEPDRIKVCDNPDCLWVFYDSSKNRSRRWCESATGCGLLMKVRRFRGRRKRAPTRRHGS